MTSMRAIQFAAYGPPSTLEVKTLTLPLRGPDEALVEVSAAAINPSDVKIVAGAFKPTLPRTPGRDFAGKVVKGSQRWLGKSVWGNGAGFGVTRDGAHAQFVSLPEAWLSEKPRSLSMEAAATVGVPFVTAWSTLVVAGEVRAGETVLIVGAAGAVGRAAIQIAHWKGARVIGADIKNDKDTGADIFLREVQDVWAWVHPYFDDRATAAAKQLGLPAQPQKLSALAPHSNARLAAALVRVSLDEDARLRVTG